MKYLFALLALLSPTFASCNLGENIYQSAGQYVLTITAPNNHNTGGTGFELQLDSGRVVTVTNHHVCELAENGAVAAAYQGGAWVSLRVLTTSADGPDLCLLEGMPRTTSGLHLSPRAPRIWQHVYALGHPHLRPLTLSDGYILARETIELAEDTTPCTGDGRHTSTINTFFGPMDVCVHPFDTFGLSVETWPGSSGSPLLDDTGDVVGVIFAGDNEMHKGFAVPYDKLAELLDSI